ncbi:hypothetical protein MRX96_027374 [Rhipicephalus microplus]
MESPLVDSRVPDVSRSSKAATESESVPQLSSRARGRLQWHLGSMLFGQAQSSMLSCSSPACMDSRIMPCPSRSAASRPPSTRCLSPMSPQR